MVLLHLALGLAVLVANSAAAVWGGFAWVRAHPSQTFWILLRIGQATVIVQIVVGTVFLISRQSSVGLHAMYGVLPAVVAFFAEQLRLASAETVLSARDIKSRLEIEELSEDQQADIALTIMRREIGVMTMSAFVVVVLAWRAAVAV